MTNEINGVQSKVASVRIARIHADKLMQAGKYAEASKLAHDVIYALGGVVCTADYDALQTIAAVAFNIEKTASIAAGFNTEINAHRVHIGDTNGDKNYPHNLFIDGIHIGKFDSFDSAMNKAKEVCDVERINE